MRFVLLSSLSLLVAFGALGCAFNRNVDVRLHDNLPSIPEDQEIELWAGEQLRDKIEIAIVSSTRQADRSRATREAQMEELRVAARALGANGLENLYVHTAEAQGMVADPRVPFTAWKQGEFELDFIRATAVRYLDTAPLPPES